MWPIASTATRTSRWHAAETRCADRAAHRRPQIRRMRPRLSNAASMILPRVYTLQGKILVGLELYRGHMTTRKPQNVVGEKLFLATHYDVMGIPVSYQAHHGGIDI